MTWPRLWRLFTVPKEDTVWEFEGETRLVSDVWSFGLATCVIWRRVPRGPILGSNPDTIWRWRRWWVWAREVRP